MAFFLVHVFVTQGDVLDDLTMIWIGVDAVFWYFQLKRMEGKRWISCGKVDIRIRIYVYTKRFKKLSFFICGYIFCLFASKTFEQILRRQVGL